eukprot:2398443-Pleurochrysis_carterae.AAC.1
MQHRATCKAKAQTLARPPHSVSATLRGATQGVTEPQHNWLACAGTRFCARERDRATSCRNTTAAVDKLRLSIYKLQHNWLACVGRDCARGKEIVRHRAGTRRPLSPRRRL